MSAKGISLVWKIAICVFAVEFLGGASGILTSQSIAGWYANLEKPPGNPPNWVFGPVWTALYAMIGVSFALNWHLGFEDKDGKRARLLFFVQMALNIAWTPMFFGLHQMLVALVIIVLLWATILATIIAFSKRSKLAAWLMVPYIIWVSYATYLNAAYWFLNRGA
ncbi:MAG: TspO/MBR family protein [Verrucomicrobiota bacterium]